MTEWRWRLESPVRQARLDGVRNSLVSEKGGTSEWRKGSFLRSELLKPSSSISQYVELMEKLYGELTNDPQFA